MRRRRKRRGSELTPLIDVLFIMLFASLVQDYVRLKNLSPEGLKEGRMIALVGDAELDEGNMYEALLEGCSEEKAHLQRWRLRDYRDW